MNGLDGIEIVSRTSAGPWFTIRGVVHGKVVSVDVPKNQFDGLSESAIEHKMKRCLRAGLPYAERDV